MSDDNSETIVSSTGNDSKLKTNSSSSPYSQILTTQISLNKCKSLNNRILSPSNINSSPISTNSSSSSHNISPMKSSSSSIRRTFNICDILARPSTSSVDSNNNNHLNHLIKKSKSQRLNNCTKIILENKKIHLHDDNNIPTNLKTVYSNSDNDDDYDDEHHDLISDCDVSGNKMHFFKILILELLVCF